MRGSNQFALTILDNKDRILVEYLTQLNQVIFKGFSLTRVTRSNKERMLGHFLFVIRAIVFDVATLNCRYAITQIHQLCNKRLVALLVVLLGIFRTVCGDCTSNRTLHLGMDAAQAGFFNVFQFHVFSFGDRRLV
jgi:hypothetical protein